MKFNKSLCQGKDKREHFKLAYMNEILCSRAEDEISFQIHNALHKEFITDTLDMDSKQVKRK